MYLDLYKKKKLFSILDSIKWMDKNYKKFYSKKYEFIK